MSEALERVRGWFAAGELVRPDPDEPNAVDLARALARLGGVPARADDGPGVGALAAAIGPADHVVFTLVDGLGLATLERLPPGCFLRRRLARELRSVFPSATAAAVTSLATGEWPGRHAVPGWWTHLPEHGVTAVSLPFVERFDGRPLGELGITTDVYPCRPLLSDYRRDVCSFQPAPIADSTFSRYFRGRTPSAGYEELGGAVDAVLERVRAAAGPTYTYLYTSAVDEASHRCGPAADEVSAEALAIDAELGRLAEGLAGRGGRLVVSADHGLVEVGDAGKHVLKHDDPLVSLLEVPPSCEPRVPVFHVRDGRHDRFQREFTERFGEAFALLTTAEVESLGLFCPPPLGEAARARLGDFCAIARGASVLNYRAGERPSSTELMRGYHGGLLPDEVRIPLVLS